MDQALLSAEFRESARNRPDSASRNHNRKVVWSSSDGDTTGNSRIDTKAEVNKRPYIDILNTIREMVFSEKLIDIQTSEIESKLTKFWLNLSDEDSKVEGLDDCSSINQIIFSCWRGNQEKEQKTEGEYFWKTLYIQKKVEDLKTPIKEIVFDYHLSETWIRSIVNNTEKLHLNRTSLSSKCKTMLMNSALVKDKTESFLNLCHIPITEKEVWTFVFKEIGIRVPLHLVWTYMNENLKLSYKIGKSRTVLYDYCRSMLIKSYFCIIVAKLFT